MIYEHYISKLKKMKLIHMHDIALSLATNIIHVNLALKKYLNVYLDSQKNNFFYI